jgi:hypothetical protein
VRSTWLLRAKRDTNPFQPFDMNISPIKQMSGWLPIVMSLAALAVVLGHIAIYGAVRETDEGTAAHIWQILMAAQIPIIAFFAIKWLPRTPGPAGLVLALQGAAVISALAPVFYFGL